MRSVLSCHGNSLACRPTYVNYIVKLVKFFLLFL